MRNTEEVSEKNLRLSLADLTENAYLKEALNSKIIKYFSVDVGTKIGVITALSTAGALVIKILDYIKCQGYLSVFSMEIKFSGYSAGQGLSKLLVQAVSFMAFALTVSMFYWLFESCRNHFVGIKAEGKKKKFIRFLQEICSVLSELLMLIVFCAIINMFLLFTLAKPAAIAHSGIREYIISLGVLIVLQIVLAAILFFVSHFKLILKNHNISGRKSKRQSNGGEPLVNPTINKNIWLDTNVLSILLVILVCVTYFYCWGKTDAVNTRDFPIIDNRYAVVYQYDGNYWTVRASEIQNKIILDTKYQKAIPVDNTEIEFRHYNTVSIK